jgi:3-dehydroquinate synthase
VSEKLNIQSHKGVYSVHFENQLLANAGKLLAGEPHFLIDANVARLYAKQLKPILDHKSCIVIEATEENKSIERIIPVFEQLVSNSVRRDHTLVAIGGGIIQDITCFIASTLLRGLAWKFVPTTLLSQADSCIGSKSSINLGKTKNIIGTFNPPNEIFVCTDFLDTLENKEILSGIGEILKVHAIDSAASFDQLSADYDAMLSDRTVLLAYIRRALLIKQRFIEVDEFDRGVRNIFNYGHSFGHAIEAATNFGVPHGIAVAMGMDMANRIASLRGLITEQQYKRMHPVLRKNYVSYAKTNIPLDEMLSALLKDKKNTSSKLVLIFPVGDNASIQRVEATSDDLFRKQCQQFFREMEA